MFDFDGLIQDAVFASLGGETTLTPADYGKPVALAAVDKTAGVEVFDAKAGIATIRAAAYVRVSDLEAAGLTRAECRKATLCMNGKRWTVENAVPKPGMGGEASGELMLLLTEAC